MPRLEVREACFIHGEPVEVGGEVSVDETTARLLVLSGRAVVATAKPEPEPEPEPPAPLPRTTKARSTPTPTAK